jgi:hypothetical protein
MVVLSIGSDMVVLSIKLQLNVYIEQVTFPYFLKISEIPGAPFCVDSAYSVATCLLSV